MCELFLNVINNSIKNKTSGHNHFETKLFLEKVIENVKKIYTIPLQKIYVILM